MPDVAQGRRAQKMMQPNNDDDPYVMLVLAMLPRAVEDAQGRCVHPGDQTPDQIEAAARRWLQDGRELVTLLELAGYDAEPVLRRVQRLLAPDRRATL